MVGVVHLGYQISDGQLQLQRLHPPRGRMRHQVQRRAEEIQDRGDLCNDLAARLQEWRREGLRTFTAAIEKRLHHRIAVHPRHVDVVGTGILQRQPHELATALDAGPVIQRVLHGSASTEQGSQPRALHAKQV